MVYSKVRANNSYNDNHLFNNHTQFINNIDDDDDDDKRNIVTYLAPG